jgi:glucose-1-phosphate cytidylyltransferase
VKTVILAGGLGSRLAEETNVRPKPMVEIGGRPILWHIMNIYAAHGFREFVIACGYKGDMIKQYFSGFHLYDADMTVHLRHGKVQLLNARAPDWTVTLVDTGFMTSTGGRIKRVEAWLGNETFLMTYGDGVGNVDIRALVDFHHRHGKLATITAVRPPARFGAIEFDGDQVVRFHEKPQVEVGWINGGFMALEPGVLDYITDDDTLFEGYPLERLAEAGQLVAFRHDGFWQPMDTLREKHLLEDLWANGNAPWKVWSD